MAIDYERKSKSEIFNIDFDIQDYRDILPDIKSYIRDDEIINQDQFQKGNIEFCFWKRYNPSRAEITSTDFLERETNRMLNTGAWIRVKEEIIWIPPSYYMALQYGKVGESDLQFRLKRLKHVYHKIRARKNANCMGTLTIKNRADGETTMAMTDGVWECADGNMNVGQVGIQSKTRSDALNPCWSTVQVLWQSMPTFVKDILYPDFASGDNIQQKLTFMRDRNEELGLAARNILIQYYPCVYNAMDGKHNMKKCILDEVCKWREAEFYDTFTNYSKFLMPGFERRGLFDMFSSPSDVPCKSNEQVYEVWKNSDINELQANGTTKSKIFRYFSHPLEGIQGAYDKYGDVDPQRIYDWIMNERKTVPKDKLMGEIRAFPLNEEEAFGSFDGGSLWTNVDGIKKRSIFLIGQRFKDNQTKEPTRVFGNLERVDGYIDGDVQFRQFDGDHFDLYKGRFCFSFLPQNKQELKNIFKPPQYVENCLGFDPTANRYVAKNVVEQSNAAMVNRKMNRDIYETGVRNVPTMIYCCRPSHQEIIFEDVIKAAIFNRAMIQYENRSDKFENYAEDRGYEEWLLPTMNAKAGSKRKGDAPSGGKNAFLNEGIGLIDANTNLPLNPGDPYWLENHWHPELLDDYLIFNPLDTHKMDLTMADIQALIGCVKITYKKMRQPSAITDTVLAFVLDD